MATILLFLQSVPGTVPALPPVPGTGTGEISVLGGTLGIVVTLAYWAWVKIREMKVNGATTGLDQSVLSAGSSMMKLLQDDIARLRTERSEDEARWQEQMAKLQTRLDAMGTQVDAAIAAKQLAEGNAAALRTQVKQLGGTPVA